MTREEEIGTLILAASFVADPHYDRDQRVTYTDHKDQPQRIEGWLLLTKDEDWTRPFSEHKAIAQAWLDEHRIPASVGLKPTTLSAPEGVYPGLVFNVKLLPDGTTGKANETGVKRYRRLLALMAQHGIPVGWRRAYRNGYDAQQELDEALAGQGF